MALTFKAVRRLFQRPSDAAGKDGVNPQGCPVFAFKKPSSEGLDHDFLWRRIEAARRTLAARGK